MCAAWKSDSGVRKRAVGASWKAKAKLDKLGIKIESIHYTQGYYDFVDIVDAPNPEAMLAFSVWYSTQRLGRIQSMPAFDAKSFEAAIKDAAG
ncbi:MAG TPA: GYD domain-containing protein [Xanthobacteraceae bacterium]|nr:GYD domain-containing protein [Xanthobacteraceae bacterium]